ncbi:MAG TPA: cytochrome P450 [Spongiibacteraceae bacterium]|nr:cytochrome P450 [Spongiibacteraceae bacterium]
MTIPSPLLPNIDFAHDEVPNLHELLDSLRAHGSVVPVRYHGQPTWLINGFEELSQAFADEVHFQSAATYMIHGEPSMGRTLQTMAGEEHRINRGLVSRAFFPAEVRSQIESLIEPVANELLDAIEGRDELDIIPAFSRPFPFRVITRLFGIPVKDEPKLLEWALKLIDYPWDPVGAVKARHDFADYLKPFLDERRTTPGDDLLSMLATAEFEGQQLSDEEIYSFARMIYPAGSDTAYKNGGSLLYAILSDPKVRALVQAGDKEREAVVQEGLRWESPVALLPRMCSKSVTLGGVDIQQGEWTLFGITAANSDPKVFADPRRFDPMRNHKTLVFGSGAHFCLGSHLARRELETAMKLLFERFPNIALAADKPVEIIGGVLRGPRELWVRPRG